MPHYKSTDIMKYVRVTEKDNHIFSTLFILFLMLASAVCLILSRRELSNTSDRYFTSNLLYLKFLVSTLNNERNSSIDDLDSTILSLKKKNVKLWRRKIFLKVIIKQNLVFCYFLKIFSVPSLLSNTAGEANVMERIAKRKQVMIVFILSNLILIFQDRIKA